MHQNLPVLYVLMNLALDAQLKTPWEWSSSDKGNSTVVNTIKSIIVLMVLLRDNRQLEGHPTCRKQDNGCRLHFPSDISSYRTTLVVLFRIA